MKNCNNGWISVKDKLPDEMEYVLVCYSEGVWIGKRISETEYILVDDLGISNTVTHWMPLPNQPETN